MTTAATPAAPATTVVGRAMGCLVRVTVSAPVVRQRLVADAFRRLRHLERCWSRFLPHSDISRLNRAGGGPVAVDPSTVVLVGEMAAGMRATSGSFDPTVLGSIVGLGLAAAWCAGGTGGGTGPAADRLAWIEDTFIDPEGPTIRTPDGLRLDPGAIGKGLAADLVAAELVAAGATGARIVVGGDARVVMPSTIDVHDPTWSRAIDRVAVADGGIATSGIGAPPAGGRRRGLAVIDPRSRRPLDDRSGSDIVQVTVAAATASMAEVLATAILVDGCDRRDDLDRSGVGVLAVRADGGVTANSSWAQLRRAVDHPRTTR